MHMPARVRDGSQQSEAVAVITDLVPRLRPQGLPLNEAAFDALTPEAAYWAGFLFGDGAIHNNKLTLALKVDDGQHVARFRVFIGSLHQIRVIDNGANNFLASLTVGSQRLCRALHAIGFTGTKEVRFPCPELAASPDFWRGLVDADGNIDPKHLCMNLAGRLPIILAFRQWCQTIRFETNVFLQPHKNGKTWYAIIRGTHVAPMLRVLYPEGCVALPRKRDGSLAVIAAKEGSTAGQAG